MKYAPIKYIINKPSPNSLVNEHVNGNWRIIRKAGTEILNWVKSISTTDCIINTPTNIKAGEAAVLGIKVKIGRIHIEKRIKMPQLMM
jgi:hypothetical protein